MAAQTTEPVKKEGTLKNEAEESAPVARPLPKPEPEKVLSSWKAPARPFKRRDREFWVTTIAIAVIFGLILFLVEGIMPVVLIISIVFLVYVLSTVEPEKIEYQITNRGVKIAGNLTQMQVFTQFWFTKRLNSEVLVLGMISLPGRLELVINSQEKDNIRKALSTYLVEEEAPPSKLDRTTNWISSKLPQ